MEQKKSWTRFFYAFTGEGYTRPLFFLPTHRSPIRYGYHTWIFPLAFVVIIYVSLRSGFFALWRDLVEAARLLEEKAERSTPSHD